MTQRFATRAIHAGQPPDPSTGAIMTPIYATSTYVQPSPGVNKGFEYSRTRNPTRLAYEQCVADLEGGARGLAFASGLAATATLLELLDAGSHLIASDDLYGGSVRLFERVRRRSAGMESTFVDLSNPRALEQALRPNTRLIWVETPSNPMLKVVDLHAIVAFARAHNLMTVADNTFASPYLQRPLEYGFDAVVHSATKYLNGHSDIIGGIVVAREVELGRTSRVPAECRRRSGQPVRLLPRTSWSEDAPPPYGKALQQHALELARWLERPSRRGARDISLSPIPSATPTGVAADAFIRRHVVRSTPWKPVEDLPPRARESLSDPRVSRESRRCREPDRASRDHDPRLPPARAKGGVRHLRFSDPSVGRGGRR